MIHLIGRDMVSHRRVRRRISFMGVSRWSDGPAVRRESKERPPFGPRIYPTDYGLSRFGPACGKGAIRTTVADACGGPDQIGFNANASNIFSMGYRN